MCIYMTFAKMGALIYKLVVRKHVCGHGRIISKVTGQCEVWFHLLYVVINNQHACLLPVHTNYCELLMCMYVDDYLEKQHNTSTCCSQTCLVVMTSRAVIKGIGSVMYEFISCYKQSTCLLPACTYTMCLNTY